MKFCFSHPASALSAERSARFQFRTAVHAKFRRVLCPAVLAETAVGTQGGPAVFAKSICCLLWVPLDCSRSIRLCSKTSFYDTPPAPSLYTICVYFPGMGMSSSMARWIVQPNLYFLALRNKSSSSKVLHFL